MNTVSWIIFDLGGIIVPETSGPIVRHLADEIGIRPADLQNAADRHYDRAATGEIALLELCALVLRDLGIKRDPDRFLEHYLSLYREYSMPYDETVLALIRDLRSRYRIACFSNTEREVAEYSRTTGLFEHFERCYLSIDIGLRKPDPRAYRAVLQDLACPAADALFIDDREENVAGACAVGMQAFRFRNPSQLREALQALLPWCPPGRRVY